MGSSPSLVRFPVRWLLSNACSPCAGSQCASGDQQISTTPSFEFCCLVCLSPHSTHIFFLCAPPRLPAPKNESFAALPEGALDTLLLPENVDQLRDILLYHAVNESLLSTSLESRNVTTLNGDTIEIIVLDSGSVTINGANVTTTDLTTGNGVVHVINEGEFPCAAAFS